MKNSQKDFKNPNNHPSFKLAIDDRDFLTRNEMRGMRLSLEYLKPEMSLLDWGVNSTVSVFGSARIRPRHEIEEKISLLAKNSGSYDEMAKLEKQLKMSHFYDEAQEFSRIASESGGSMNPYGRKRYNVLATGGGPGIMEAVNKGAFDVGAPNIGFGIELPFEQGNNQYITPGLSFNFHYFSVRKFHLVQRASAIVVFPGGMGSLDELAEAVTLRQTNKAHDYLILLYGKEFWTKVVNFDYLIETGVISASDMDLLLFADSPQEAWHSLIDAGLYIPE